MKPPAHKSWMAAVCGLAVLLTAALGCGGGGGGGGTTPPPPPPTLLITTTTLNDGVVGQAYSQTVAVTGGTGARTFSVSAGSLGPDLMLNTSTGAITGTPSAPGTLTFTIMVVDSGTPQQSDTQAFTLDVNNDLVIMPAALPNASIGSPYNATVTASGGTQPYTFTISSGSPPAGITMNAAGVFSGPASSGATSQTFTVRVADSSTPQDTDTEVFTINVNAATGRNDTIATATSLGNGTHSASISPSGDPNTALSPDEDFYRITTTAASTVSIDINAQSMGSPLDSVIEIVDVNGVQLNLCSASMGAPFNQLCENDDVVLGVQLDSFLQIQVGGATTFYVHVVDFRGDARPDLLYDLVISGIN